MKPDYYIIGLMVITAVFVGALALFEDRARREKLARDQVERDREAVMAAKRLRRPRR